MCFELGLREGQVGWELRRVVGRFQVSKVIRSADDEYRCAEVLLAAVRHGYAGVERMRGDVGQRLHMIVISRFAFYRASIAATVGNVRAVDAIEYAFHGGHVVVKLRRGLLHRCHVVGIRQNIVGGAPAYGIGGCTVNHHEVRYRFGQSGSHGSAERAKCSDGLQSRPIVTCGGA
jgi:hypothetical protein